MIIGYAHLCAADVEAWQAGATTWRRLAEQVEDRVAEFDATAAGLRLDWRGTAADAASVAIADLRELTAACRGPIEQTGRLLAEHTDRVAAARRALLAARTPAEAALAVHAARQSDERTAVALAELTASMSAPCPPAAGPVAVREWWRGLSKTQREVLLLQSPERIGGLDGVPVADRDRANREVLRRERDRLSALFESLADDRHAARERDRVERALAGLATLADRLARPGAYLLGLDTAGDGRAIVALGDPDHSDNVLTYVPGMGVRLDGHLGTSLDRTAAMAEAAAAADPAKSTSAVLWLGYDAPDNLLEGASSGAAHDARTALHDFQEGLAATHVGDLGEQSVVGHSYGALVVGETVRDLGLRADDLVFLGAPGVGVEHAADLHVDPATVWAASANNDIVGLAAPSLRQLWLEQLWPRYMGDPMPDLWHGHNPADDGFGGHVFEAADNANPISAHLAYWDRGNPALTNVGRIAAGQESGVSSPPAPES
ncbi:alpha/beta hydrolase [Hamadaea sp. NPDC050747]|uniref:alpha/beta hydrolase n=1 Tax=Hamadaea sp. NPDC050747 TaxID=3155789 RepID=UPI00340D0A20